MVSALEFRISLKGKTYLCARAMENIDVALLPIMGRVTMDIDEAVQAALAIKLKVVVPMHRREASAEEFKQKVEARSRIKVLAISPGEYIDP